MANRVFDKRWGLGNDRVHISGRFRPNGAGAVDNTLNKGLGFSVARTGAGAFTVTLDDRYTEIESANVIVFLDAVADLNAQVGTVDASVGTVEINILAVATPTDIASDVNNWVAFDFVLKNTGVQP